MAYFRENFFAICPVMPLQRPWACVTIQSLNGHGAAVPALCLSPLLRKIPGALDAFFKDAFCTSRMHFPPQWPFHLSIQESREEIGFRISDSSESWTTRIMR